MNPATASRTEQIQTWTGTFGREYTDRNDYSPATLDQLYRERYGISRRQLNEVFLRDIPKTARILEVGCNMGTQLLLLREMRFGNLHGIDIQAYALAKATLRLPGVELSQASALAIPYPDHYFDLVFTSGVLIHIAPHDLPLVMAEIHRCTKRWIWGLEYFATHMTEINYRGHGNLLWKADYARLYTDQFSDLETINEQRLLYLHEQNQDSMFLLRQKPDQGDKEPT